MDAEVSLEIVRNGLGGNVLPFHAAARQLLEIGLEGSQVAGEDRHSPVGQQTRDADEQLHMVALHVPGASAMAFELEKVGGSTKIRS